MSISRYMVALLDAPPIRSGERGYMDCGFPAALVSRVILRSVRRARTAFCQFSRLPRRPYSGRPKPPTRSLTHNRPPSPRSPSTVYAVVPHVPPIRRSGVLRFPCLYTLLAALSTDLQGPANGGILRRDDPDRARRSASSEHVYISDFDTCDSTARDVHLVYVVKNINLQYKPPQNMRSCRQLVGLAYRATMADS